MAKKPERFRTKEDLSAVLDKVIADPQTPARDIIQACSTKAKIEGFGEGPDMYKMSTENRWVLGRKVIGPAIMSLFDVEVIDDGPGSALRADPTRDPDSDI
jgi:hypothetical protein